MTTLRILPPKTRVAYCGDCNGYADEGEAGRLCFSCARKLRLRVGYICPECECRNIFFDRKEYLNHRCEDYGP